MSNAEYRNANRVWAAIERIRIARGDTAPMTVGEVALEASASPSMARKYMNIAVSSGALERHVHNKTFSTYTRIYQDQS